MLQPWRIRFPGRLEYEVEKLKEIGVSCEPKLEGDTISLQFPYNLDGEKIDLIIKFPSSYPYLRFTVDAPNIELHHHHNPFNKDLCILGRSTVNWETTDTVAATLTTQMPKVIKAGRSKDIDEVKELEENQPEPISVYFVTSGFVFIDGEFHVGEGYIGQWGNLEVGINSNKSELSVLSICDKNGKCIANANHYIEGLFKQKISGRWIRIDKPVIENNLEHFFESLVSMEPTLKAPRWQRLINNVSIDIIGVVFSEEVKQREESGEGWLFLIRKI
ncbi:MAG: E2/UBC family protein [Thermodesulfovibrionales bacterium]